jgi:hypothetical protein
MGIFNWSLLDRSGIAKFVWQISPNIVKQPLTVSAFHSIVSTHLKKSLPIRVKKSINPKVLEGFVYIGGTYYSDFDAEHKKCLEIVFQYTNKDNILDIGAKRFWRICNAIADALLHELIHMRQYRRRAFKILPDYASTAEKTEQKQEQSYLGCSDEIDAYGFNIACELMDKFKGDQLQVIEYLNENQKGKKRKHNSWRMYLKAFEHDHNHIILRRVKKKIVRYLGAAKMGKPYRNKDWITW